MRYDTPIYFQLIRQGIYDPKTGDYADSDPVETKVYADVTDTSTDTKQILYGDIKRNSKVIRLQQHYTRTYNRIRIGDKQYGVDDERKLRTKHVLIVSEVGHGRNGSIYRAGGIICRIDAKNELRCR